METTVKERLIRFIKYKNLSQKRFEEAVGLANGYVNNIRKSITEEKLQKIALQFPELSKLWLLTGEGEMLATDVTPMRISETTDYATSKSGLKFKQREDGKIIMEVPIVPISALGSNEDDYATIIENDELERMSFLVDAVHHGKYVAFRVDGDSMDDGTRFGFARKDLVLVRELSRDKWLPRLHYREWPYWVVVFGNNVRIKQIIDQDDAGNITLHSLNPSPEYCDFTLNMDDISRLYNVVQHIPHPNIFK
jgi:phage repressor protein C with HTH and peptisase S24 domain